MKKQSANNLGRQPGLKWRTEELYGDKDIIVTFDKQTSLSKCILVILLGVHKDPLLLNKHGFIRLLDSAFV